MLWAKNKLLYLPDNILYDLALMIFFSWSIFEIVDTSSLFLGLFLFFIIFGMHDIGHPGNIEGIAPFNNFGFFNCTCQKIYLDRYILSLWSKKIFYNIYLLTINK